MTRTYLTVSIPYVNAAPHVGYALELVEADALARHLRQRGHEVRLLGGTDDHAIKNAVAAEAAGVATAAFVDANARRFEALAGPLDIAFDDFIRTSTDPRHRPGVERLWRLTEANGDLYRTAYEGLYCVGCEQFVDEADAPDGRCTEHDTALEHVQEDNWFFRLSRYAQRLRTALTDGTIRIVPEVYANEVLALIERGLDDISVSRSIARARGWGIPVPGDATQVVYVWWEALTNYITALGFGTDDAAYDDWWRGADHRIHVIGKGILRFHALYWPALLLSTGQPLPTTIHVHPYLTANGRKISKSTGNVVDPVAAVERFGTDALRWWLLADVPRAADADYTDERVAERADADLANGVGNVAHRVLTMVQRFRHGRVPAGAPSITAPDVDGAYDAFDFRAVAGLIRAHVRATNETIDATRPWTLASAERDGAPATVLDVLLTDLVARLRVLAYLLAPLVPGTARRLQALLTPDADGVLPVPVPLATRVAEVVKT